MANLKTIDKQILEKLFQMGGGYVLNFSDRTMEEFFRDDLGINIYDEKYNYGSNSKANKMRGFWLKEDDKTAGRVILKLIEYIETQILLGFLQREDFPIDTVSAGRKVAEKLLGGKVPNDWLEKKREEVEIRNNLVDFWKNKNITEASIEDGVISITLQNDVFSHVKGLLKDGHYYNAVEEAYKIVRSKLKSITGKEKATDAFCVTNYEKIFGHQPMDDAEKDFFEGVKFLHMAIQFLRNEKAHRPATELDKNLAIHYISLASLAYDLINRNTNG